METIELAPIEINPTTFLYHHCALPALPKVVTQFQEVAYAENVSISRVVNILSSDPSLVAEILKVVNSAYYSLPREVSRVDMAVAYLGTREVQNIVLTASVVDTFGIKEPAEFKKFWHHSLYTALCARHLANRFERHLPYGDLWAPALLHDIGKLVYLKFFPEHFKALRRFADEQGCLFNEAEQIHGMPSSAYLGALLCERWRLPKKIREVCALEGPHELANGYDREPLKPLQRIVLLGDLVAVLSTDPLQKEKQRELSNTIMQELDLTESDFLILMGAISDLRLEADRLAG